MGSFISTNWSPLWYGEYADFTELEDLYNIVMATTCVISAGLAAGLTMGLLSLGIDDDYYNNNKTILFLL